MTTPINRGNLAKFESAVAKAYSGFKTQFDALSSAGSGISTTALVKMLYSSNFMGMLIDMSSSVLTALKDTTKTISQKM